MIRMTSESKIIYNKIPALFFALILLFSNLQYIHAESEEDCWDKIDSMDREISSVGSELSELLKSIENDYLDYLLLTINHMSDSERITKQIDRGEITDQAGRKIIRESAENIGKLGEDYRNKIVERDELIKKMADLIDKQNKLLEECMKDASSPDASSPDASSPDTDDAALSDCPNCEKLQKEFAEAEEKAIKAEKNSAQLESAYISKKSENEAQISYNQYTIDELKKDPEYVSFYEQQELKKLQSQKKTLEASEKELKDQYDQNLKGKKNPEENKKLVKERKLIRDAIDIQNKKIKSQKEKISETKSQLKKISKKKNDIDRNSDDKKSNEPRYKELDKLQEPIRKKAQDAMSKLTQEIEELQKEIDDAKKAADDAKKAADEARAAANNAKSKVEECQNKRDEAEKKGKCDEENQRNASNEQKQPSLDLKKFQQISKKQNDFASNLKSEPTKENLQKSIKAYFDILEVSHSTNFSNLKFLLNELIQKHDLKNESKIKKLSDQANKIHDKDFKKKLDAYEKTFLAISDPSISIPSKSDDKTKIDHKKSEMIKKSSKVQNIPRILNSDLVYPEDWIKKSEILGKKLKPITNEKINTKKHETVDNKKPKTPKFSDNEKKKLTRVHPEGITPDSFSIPILIKFQNDKIEFPSNSEQIIIIEHTAANKDRNVAEEITVRLFSDSDRKGIQFNILETGPNTGKFQGNFKVGDVSKNGDKFTISEIKVSDGDTITAAYVTKTVRAKVVSGQSYNQQTSENANQQTEEIKFYFDSQTYAINSSLNIHLNDNAMNRDPNNVEIVAVHISSTSDPVGFDAGAFESGPNSGKFVVIGSLIDNSPSDPDTHSLYVSVGDIITASAEGKNSITAKVTS